MVKDIWKVRKVYEFRLVKSPERAVYIRIGQRPIILNFKFEIQK